MLFARFMVIYGHKFKSSFETEQELNIAKREWAQSLTPYTEDVLQHALELAKQHYSWMPSIAEFLQLIQQVQTRFGLPNVNDALIEACAHAKAPLTHHWSHAVVYHAGKAIGWYELASYHKTNLEPLFQRHYQDLCEQVLAGVDMPMPVVSESS